MVFVERTLLRTVVVAQNGFKEGYVAPAYSEGLMHFNADTNSDQEQQICV